MIFGAGTALVGTLFIIPEEKAAASIQLRQPF